MRIDKYLKVSRIIKRRAVAKDACDQGRVLINDKVVKAGAIVSIGDIITIRFGAKEIKVKVINLSETVRKNEAEDMYESI